MKIAHVIFGLTGGGAETMLVNIANCQVEAGNDVTIIVINDYYEQALVDALDSRIALVMLGRRRGSRNPWPLVRLNIQLARFSPEIVHIHVPSIQRYLLPRFRKISCATLHSVVKDEDAPHLRRVTSVCSISDHVADDLLRRHDLKSTVIVNGIGARRFLHRRTPRHASDKLRIVCVARLFHEVKGQHVLIEALPTLVNHFGVDATVDFIGDGDSLDFLKSLAVDRGVGDRVSFLGYRPQSFIEAHLHEYDLMVLPSLTEGFGLSAAEGMAAGIETLVSSRTGSCDVIDNGRLGYIFDNGNAADCARVIAGIASRDADQAMTAAARQRALDMYDVSVTADKYLKHYKEIAKK